jgi:hypothetical protein
MYWLYSKEKKIEDTVGELALNTPGNLNKSQGLNSVREFVVAETSTR